MRSKHEKKNALLDKAFYHSTHEYKQTHFRAWKRGKTWVYASAVVVLFAGNFANFANPSFLSAFGTITVQAVTTTPQSGVWGTIQWSLDGSGNLTLGNPSDTTTEVAGPATSCPWSYLNTTNPLPMGSVYTINIVSPISAGTSSTALYSFFTYYYGQQSPSTGGGSSILSSLTSITGLANLVVQPGQNPVSMFAGDTALTTIDLPNNFVNSTMTYIADMFYGDTSLQAVDVSQWNTSNLISIAGAFTNCSSITTLAVDNWNVSSINQTMIMFGNGGSSASSGFFGAFEGMTKLNSLNVANWQLYTGTSQTVGFDYTFAYDPNLATLNVSNWNTSRVSSLSSTFYSDTKLSSLDVSKWNTSSLTNIQYIFYRDSALTSINVSGWNTTNVTYFSSAFQGTGLTTIDLTNWTINAKQLKNAGYMLATTNGLNQIKIGSGITSLSGTNIPNIAGSWAMIGSGTATNPAGPFYSPTFANGIYTSNASTALMAATLSPGTYITIGFVTGSFGYSYDSLTAAQQNSIPNFSNYPTTAVSFSGSVGAPIPYSTVNFPTAPAGYYWSIVLNNGPWTSGITYNAYALDVNGSGVNQYVQVFDGRALSNGAWSLAVSQEGQFGTTGANSGTLLKGAVITLSGGVIGGDNAGITNYAPATVTLTSNETGTTGADTSGGYTVNGFTGAPSGNQSHVFASTTDTSGNELGHGVNLYSFGGKAFAGTMTSTSTGNGVLTGATGITPSLVASTGTNDGHDAQYNTVNTLTPGYNANAQLSVPGNAATPAAYSTTLDWTLYDTPDFS